VRRVRAPIHPLNGSTELRQGPWLPTTTLYGFSVPRSRSRRPTSRPPCPRSIRLYFDQSMPLWIFEHDTTEGES
jgi:hypothetical protein